MKVAALDLGTNTFILLVAEVENGQVQKVWHDEVRIVRLGQGVHESRRFHPEALARAEEAFAAFSQVIKSQGVARVLACATSAARDVKNGDELIQLAKRYDIPVEIISGEQEAEFTFAGTLTGSESPGPVVIIDVGGGSTELINGEVKDGRAQLLSRRSLDVGSVRLTELFVTKHPVPPAEIQKISDYIQARIEEAAFPKQIDSTTRTIAVAGTPTTLATLDQGLPFETDRVDGYVFSVKRLEDWVHKLAALTVEQRQALAGMEPKRADVIVAGAMVLLKCAKAFNAKEMHVSVRGLRYGIARSLGAH